MNNSHLCIYTLVTLLALISYNTSQAVATVNVTSPSQAVFWTLVHTDVSIVTIFSAPYIIVYSLELPMLHSACIIFSFEFLKTFLQNSFL